MTHPDTGLLEARKTCKHAWSEWVLIALTGDWFHPRVFERTCSKCGATEQDEP